ncbi:MAG: hypothetical protein K2Q18_06105 [Bdellovibrionales bacterium]|nr:hypothetical protein [Bdellovibrionales bacterium]
MDIDSREDYDRIKNYIARILRGYSLNLDAEDFTQDLVLGLLQGKHKKQSLSQFVIDNLRKNSGKKSSKSYKQRVAMEFYKKLYDNYIGDEKYIELINKIAIREILNNIDMKDLGPYLLGYSSSQIGKINGVSESRVLQRINDLYLKIRNRIEKKPFKKV